MRFKIYFCLHFLGILGLTWLSAAVKVNMHGTVVLGKEVMDTLTYYLNQHHVEDDALNGRRSIPKVYDPIKLQTKAAQLCKNLDVCSKELRTFVNEYVEVLGKAVTKIFDGVISKDKVTPHKEGSLVFGEQYTFLLQEVKQILKRSNNKVSDENEEYIWTDIVKKISAKFQNKAILFVNDNIEGKDKQILDFKKNLIQKLVLGTVVVEEKYLRVLCVTYNICMRSIECTRALNILLERFKTVSEKKTKAFIRAFYEVLQDFSFYYLIREETSNDFQLILNDMAHSESIPARNVLLSVQKSVEGRLNAESTKTKIQGGYDVILLNILLSDMDYIYSKHKLDPFHTFLNNFFEWLKSDHKLNNSMRQVMKNIENKLSFHDEGIVWKLINEVRVFLEITVEMDK